MAVDVITGKQIKPQFQGQRTTADINFDPAAWQEQWELGEQGDVAGVEAQAIQSIKDALATRYEGQDYWNIDQQGLEDYWAAENAANMGTPGYQEYVPTAEELAYTGDARLQDEASRIFREQIMGGYNPNINYRDEGVTPNVFLRSGEGLGGWEAMGRPPTPEQPRGVPLGYGVPEVPGWVDPATTQTSFVAPPPVAPPAPAAPAPTPTPLGGEPAPAAPAAPAAPEVDPAIAQREIVTKALADRLKPIQAALAAGIIDVTAAETAWNTARTDIYSDFLTEQVGVQTGFQTQADIDEAKRQADRTKLIQDLNAAGVDSGMVADELALIDAITEASGQERMGLIGDIGRIGMMSDADRRMMGEGIFGGQRQALRTDARQMGLEAELLAVGQGQTADERSLQAQLLAPYMDVGPGALFADLYSDIDLTGMATGREQMEWGTGERIGGQEWQTGERIGSQTWQSAENVLDRTFTTTEREAVQDFTTDERVASQDWAHDERIGSEEWTAAENLLGRDFTTDEREAVEAWNTLEREESQTWQAGESALDRAISQQVANTQKDQLEEQIRQFGLGQLSSGIDMRQTIRVDIPGVGSVEVPNPRYGLPAGFDTATGLTAAQSQDQENFLAGLVAQGIDVGGTGQAFGFNEETGLTAAQSQDQANFLAGQTAQGIDQRETITRHNPWTGVMETIPNPGFGRPMGFDAATGLTAGETVDEAYRQDVLGADAAAATQAQENWQAIFDADVEAVTQTQENWQDTFDQSKDEFEAGLKSIGIDPATGYVMGLDTAKRVLDTELGLIDNPTYGMTTSEAASYAATVAAAVKGTGQGEELSEDWLLRELMYQTWGKPDQAALTDKALRAIKDRIGANENVIGGGLTPGNILWALGTLQAEDDDFAEIYADLLQSAYADSYPGMAAPVTPGSSPVTSGNPGAVSPAAAVTPGADDTTQAIQDAAAAAAVTGPTYGPDVGQAESETIGAGGIDLGPGYPDRQTDATGNIPTGERLQGTKLVPSAGTVHPKTGILTGATDAVYENIDGRKFTQAEVDAIEANIPTGWNIGEAYEPGVLGYIDWVARQGKVFTAGGRAVDEIAPRVSPTMFG